MPSTRRGNRKKGDRPGSGPPAQAEEETANLPGPPAQAEEELIDEVVGEIYNSEVKDAAEEAAVALAKALRGEEEYDCATLSEQQHTRVILEEMGIINGDDDNEALKAKLHRIATFPLKAFNKKNKGALAIIAKQTPHDLIIYHLLYFGCFPKASYSCRPSQMVSKFDEKRDGEKYKHALLPRAELISGTEDKTGYRLEKKRKETTHRETLVANMALASEDNSGESVEWFRDPGRPLIQVRAEFIRLRNKYNRLYPQAPYPGAPTKNPFLLDEIIKLRKIFSPPRDPTPTKTTGVESGDEGGDPPEAIPQTTPPRGGGMGVEGFEDDEVLPAPSPNGGASIGAVVLDNTIDDDEEVEEDSGVGAEDENSNEVSAAVKEATSASNAVEKLDGAAKPSVTSSESTAVSTTVDSTVLPPSDNSNKLSATEEETKPSDDDEMNETRFSIAAEPTSTFSPGAVVSKADKESVVGQKKNEDGEKVSLEAGRAGKPPFSISEEDRKSNESDPVRAPTPSLPVSSIMDRLDSLGNRFENALDKKVDEIQAGNEQFQQQLQLKIDAMQTKNKETLDRLQQQIAQLKAGNDLLQAGNALSQERIDQVQGQLDKLRVETNLKVSDLEGRIGGVRSDVSDVERTAKKTERKVRKVEEDTRKMFDQLNEQLEELQKELQKEREARKLVNEAVGNNDFAGGKEAVVVSCFSAESESEEDESTTGAEGLSRRNLFPQLVLQEGKQDKEAKKAQKTAPKASENVKKVRKQLEEQPDKKFEESKPKHAERMNVNGEEAVVVSAESEEDESTTGAEGFDGRILFPQFQPQVGKQNTSASTGEVEGSEATSGAGSVSSLKTGGTDEVGSLINDWNTILDRPGLLDLKKLEEITNEVSSISGDDPIMIDDVVGLVERTIGRILANEEERSTFGTIELENVLSNILGGENIKAAAERMNDRYSFLTAVHSVFAHNWLPNYAQLSALSFLYLAVDGSVTINDDFVNNSVLGTFLLAAGYRDQYTQRANGEVVLTLTKSFLKFMSSWEGRPESERERYGIKNFTDILKKICDAINELPIEAAPTAFGALEEILKFARPGANATSQHSINVDEVIRRVFQLLSYHQGQPKAQQLLAEYFESDESNSNVDLDAVDSDATQDDDAAPTPATIWFDNSCNVKVYTKDSSGKWTPECKPGRLYVRGRSLGVDMRGENLFFANIQNWVVGKDSKFVAVTGTVDVKGMITFKLSVKPSSKNITMYCKDLVKFFQENVGGGGTK